MLKCFVECELLCDAWDLGTVDAFLDSASSCLWNPRYFSQMLRRVSESHGSCSVSGNSSESGNQAVPPLTLPVWPFAGLGWAGWVGRESMDLAGPTHLQEVSLPRGLVS